MISIAENSIKKENSRYTVVFSILPFGNHVKKFGSNFNQAFSFLSKSVKLKNIYLCPTQCIDCSLTRVLLSLGQKNFTIIAGNAFF